MAELSHEDRVAYWWARAAATQACGSTVLSLTLTEYRQLKLVAEAEELRRALGVGGDVLKLEAITPSSIVGMQVFISDLAGPA